MPPPVVYQPVTPTPLTVWSALAFAAVAGGAFFMALRRPAWLLGCLAFFVPFALYRDVAGTTITLEKALLVGTLAGLLASRARLWPDSTAARTILLAGLAVLLTIVLSFAHATYLGAVGREALKQLEYVLLAWCAIGIVLARREQAPAALAIGVGGSLFIVSLVGVLQAALGGAPSGIAVDHQVVPRVAGTIEGPNQLAGYLEAAFPVIVFAPLLQQRRLVLARAVLIALAITALVLTQSRAGITMVLLGFGAALWLDRRSARSAILPLLVGVAAGVATLATWYGVITRNPLVGLERFFTLTVLQNPGGVGTRNQLWTAAVELFKRNTLFGVGAGNFERLLPTVGLIGVHTHANSLWLQTLAEQGLIGLFAMFALVFASLRTTFRAAGASWLARAAFIGSACLFVHQFVDDLFFYPKVGMLWWLLVGAATAAIGVSSQTSAADQASFPDRMGGPSSGQSTPTEGSFHLSSRS